MVGVAMMCWLRWVMGESDDENGGKSGCNNDGCGGSVTMVV